MPGQGSGYRRSTSLFAALIICAASVVGGMILHPSSALAVTTFTWTNSSTNGTIYGDGFDGDQVNDDGTNGYAPYYRDEFTSYDGNGFYRYVDNATGYCLQVDKSISGHPVVEATCSITQPFLDQQRFTDPLPNPNGPVFNLYELQNGGSNEDMCSESFSTVAFCTERDVNWQHWTLG